MTAGERYHRESKEANVITRRDFATRIGLAAAGSQMLTEAALAQRALVGGDLPSDMVWLNANENPDGPPRVSLEAMTKVLPVTGRYHYQEFGEFYATVAKSEDLSPDQVLIGSGSSEVLHAAVDAFTSPTRPLIAADPTYESPGELARSFGRSVVRVPLTSTYAADVKKLAQEAEKANGGLIYLCNPNNPTSSVTPKADIAWLVSNLPPDTIAMIDEAYFHFGATPELESALAYVRQGKNVIVTRTYSKIYGMAGLRVGFACGKPELIQKMAPFRNNVISYVAVRSVIAALGDPQVVPQRKAKLLKTRQELCQWLTERKVGFIEPHANFMMIDVGRDARELIYGMPRKGVAVGRPFPPLNNMMRVSIGTDQDMAKFRGVFWGLYKV
jgi:histidinol-phosphate aminotransferase